MMSKSTLFDIILNIEGVNENKVLNMEGIKNENNKKIINGGFIIINDVQ